MANVPHSLAWIDRLDCRCDPERLSEILGLDFEELVQEYVDNMDPDEWLGEPDFDFDEIGREISEKSGDFTYDTDASVTGPEFQSPILHGRDAAIDAAARLFAAINEREELSIDTRCSCHIHVRMENVFHTGSNSLQQLLFEELFTHVGEFPTCVKKRLQAMPTHIQPTDLGSETSRAKYNPIRRHDQGTWEFRLFGNVSNVADFETCLDLAISAMERAYTRYLNGNYTEYTTREWTTAAAMAMQRLEPVQKIYEDLGLTKKQALAMVDAC
jgi:hypothetical protein